MLQARDEYRASPYDLQNIFVRTSSGGLVPMSNVVQLSERARAQSLAREDRTRAITISATPAPGYSLGEALDFLDQVARETLPPDALRNNRDRLGIPTVPDRLSWAGTTGPTIPLPGGGDIQNADDLRSFGLDPGGQRFDLPNQP